MENTGHQGPAHTQGPPLTSLFKSQPSPVPELRPTFFPGLPHLPLPPVLLQACQHSCPRTDGQTAPAPLWEAGSQPTRKKPGCEKSHGENKTE